MKNAPRKIDPTTRVRYFAHALSRMAACGGSRASVMMYSDLESLWIGWDRPDFALWFIARTMGKKVAVKVLHEILDTYLLGPGSATRRECIGMPLEKVLKTAREWPNITTEEVQLISLLQAFLQEPTKTRWSADTACVYVMETIRWYKTGEIMQILRKAMPKKTFLAHAQRLVASVDTTSGAA